MISPSSKCFVMVAFLGMACSYVAASPGIILAESSPGPGNLSDGDAGEVEVMPVEDSNYPDPAPSTTPITHVQSQGDGRGPACSLFSPRGGCRVTGSGGMHSVQRTF